MRSVSRTYINLKESVNLEHCKRMSRPDGEVTYLLDTLLFFYSLNKTNMTQEQANMHYVIYTSSPNTEQGFGPDHTQTFNDKCECQYDTICEQCMENEKLQGYADDISYPE